MAAHTVLQETGLPLTRTCCTSRLDLAKSAGPARPRTAIPWDVLSTGAMARASSTPSTAAAASRSDPSCGVDSTFRPSTSRPKQTWG